MGTTYDEDEQKVIAAERAARKHARAAAAPAERDAAAAADAAAGKVEEAGAVQLEAKKAR